MHIDEFTDTYSDDIITLREGRVAMLTHLTMGALPDIVNSSYCRLYAIVMIGSIEAMIERWKDRDRLKILEAYFAPPLVGSKKGISNEQRVSSLADAFCQKGINIDREVFNDYLAIKYLRNAIVHANWQSQSGQLKQEQIAWLRARNFPTDARHLTEEHWQKMESVNENMMFYIALTGLLSVASKTTHAFAAYQEKPISTSPPAPPDVTGIIGASEWRRLFWNNLERISADISDHIQKAAVSDEYSWSSGLSLDEVNSMSDEERKRRYYLSASKAVLEGFLPHSSLTRWTDAALMSWSEYVRHTREFHDLEPVALQKANVTFSKLRKQKILPKDGFFPESIIHAPVNVRNSFFREALGESLPVTPDEVAEAIRIGSLAYGAVRNITPLHLFSIQLPILVPAEIVRFADVAKSIATTFEAGCAWYSFVEGRVLQKETIDFQIKMLALLTENARRVLQ